MKTEKLKMAGNCKACLLIREVEKSRKALINVMKDMQDTEKALRESEKRYRGLVENTTDAIIGLDLDAAIMTWNRGAEEMLGYMSDEVMGKHLSMIIPEELQDICQNNFYEAAVKGHIKQIETLRKSKEGRIIPVEMALAKIVNSNGEHTGYVSILRDITWRKKAEEQVSTSLKEKELLLKEVHHRVKNNMQIISSLLRLQSGQISDRKEIEVLRESQNRIKSMALIHEKLYQSDDLAHINFHDYISDLTRGLCRAYEARSGRVSLNIDIENLEIAIDTAIPCGLIINELVSNSLKHAFPEGHKGEIRVSLRKVADLKAEDGCLQSEVGNPGSEIELAVSDNGVGIPEGLDCKNAESLGLKLVYTLGENQLRGKIALDRENGTKFMILFKG